MRNLYSRQRLLLTFTVRDLVPPLGVRAIPGAETDDGLQPGRIKGVGSEWQGLKDIVGIVWRYG